jgi:hypothetical protein
VIVAVSSAELIAGIGVERILVRPDLRKATAGILAFTAVEMGGFGAIALSGSRASDAGLTAWGVLAALALVVRALILSLRQTRCAPRHGGAATAAVEGAATELDVHAAATDGVRAASKHGGDDDAWYDIKKEHIHERYTLLSLIMLGEVTHR